MKRSLAALLACAAFAAQGQERAPWEVRLEGAHESLDHPYDSWREAAAQVAWRPAPEQAFIAGARATERYGLRDNEAIAAAYLPLAPKGPTLHLEATGSSTHHVLPRSTFLAEAGLPFGQGWVALGGLKASRYSTSDVRTATATLEKYRGDWRFAYTIYLAKPDGGAWSPTHRLAATWYRSELTQAGISASRGREVENVPPQGLITSEVRNVTLTAGFEVAPRWGLVLEWAWHEQGDLYSRRSLRLGTRFLF